MAKIKTLLLLITLWFSVNAQKSVLNGGDAGTKGLLTVSVVTADPGGLWDPENVLAIWVQNSSGKLVNTMMYFTTNTWGSAQAMSEWWKLIGSQWSDDLVVLESYTLKGLDGISGPTQVDGISSPTRPSLPAYGYRFCYWGESVNLNAFADGIYTVKMELANDLAPVGTAGHQIASFQFEKGPSPVLLYPDDVLPSFKSIAINWVPNTTGFKSIDLTKEYTVFPNPALSFVFVKGEDIKSLEVMTLSGKRLLSSKKQYLNVAFLPSGTYLIKITTLKGIVTKKITKK